MHLDTRRLVEVLTEASANEMIIGNWEVLDADANGELSADELSILAQ